MKSGTWCMDDTQGGGGTGTQQQTVSGGWVMLHLLG
jgi:hypothetical protein